MPTDQPTDPRAGQPAVRRVHPSVEDPGVRALSEVVGGPVGPRAGRHRVVDPGARPAGPDRSLLRARHGQGHRLLQGEVERLERQLHEDVLLRPALPLHRTRFRRAALAVQRRRRGAGPVRRHGVPRRHLLLGLVVRRDHPPAERLARPGGAGRHAGRLARRRPRGAHGDAALRRGERGRLRGARAARRVAARRRPSGPALGRRPVRGLPGSAAGRPGELGHAGGRLRRRPRCGRGRATARC